jgi:hypothetical protein
MSTTFNVLYLGNFASIDTAEGNDVAENADSLVGMSFGGPGDALLNNFQSLSQDSFGDVSTRYSSDQFQESNFFSIDGGGPQLFDASAVYNATITYTDGTTADVSIKVFQDWMGNTYAAPERWANSDMAALEAGPIQSLELNSIDTSGVGGMHADLQTWDYAVCFSAGTKIRTPEGDIAIEALGPGSFVVTRDNGVQKIRWVGRQLHEPKEGAFPVRIVAGALGNGYPTRDLVVSRQHRILLRGDVLENILGVRETLVPAIKLVGIEGIYEDHSFDRIAYFHLLLDRHEILFANGAEAESLLLGPVASNCLSPEALEDLSQAVPDWHTGRMQPATALADNIDTQRMVAILADRSAILVEPMRELCET